jgi:hypothetical protein
LKNKKFYVKLKVSKQRKMRSNDLTLIKRVRGRCKRNDIKS